MSNTPDEDRPRSVSGLLSNYLETLRPTVAPLTPNEIGDAICALINRSGMDLRVVTDVLIDIADSAEDMAVALEETSGKLTLIELTNPDNDDAWVLYDSNGVARDVYLASRYPDPPSAWRAAANSRLTSESRLKDEGWMIGTANVQLHRYSRAW